MTTTTSRTNAVSDPLLKTGKTVQHIQFAEEKEELLSPTPPPADKDELSPVDKDVNNLAKAWLACEIHLTGINLHDQTFSVRAWINVFWKDDKLLKKLQGNAAFGDDKTEKYVDYKKFEEISDNYSLPIKPHDPFLNLMERKDDINSRIWLDPANKCFHLHFSVTCALSERFELNTFPFDAQFLNIKVPYNIKKYNFVTTMPDFVYPGSRYKYHVPIRCCKHDSVTQWNLLTPWLDMRADHSSLIDPEQKYQFYFSLIRLRVKRKPTFYLLYAILPLFLIVLSSFAIFSLTDSDGDGVGDQLGYLVTLLLTLAAYQYAISIDLPETCELTYIDSYILVGYFILVLSIMNISVTTIFIDYYDSWPMYVQVIAGAFLLFVWLFATISNVVLPYCRFRNSINWEQMSDDEFLCWNEDPNLSMDKRKYKSLNVDDRYYGSTDGGIINKIGVTKYVQYKEWLKNKKYTINKIFNTKPKQKQPGVTWEEFKTFSFH